MYFAEFYTKSAVTGEDIPACGDRAVLILDGREARQSWDAHCSKWQTQHGFTRYRIMRGESFTRAVPVTHHNRSITL